MKGFCPYSQYYLPNLLTCLEGLDAFRFFFKNFLAIAAAVFRLRTLLLIGHFILSVAWEKISVQLMSNKASVV